MIVSAAVEPSFVAVAVGLHTIASYCSLGQSVEAGLLVVVPLPKCNNPVK